MDDDDKAPSNFEPSMMPMPMRPQMGYSAPETGMPMAMDEDNNFIPMPPPEPPKDYQAMANAHVYELLSKNGAVKELNVQVTMIDKDNGSGKANVTLGKDAKMRKYEIPIAVKNGAIQLGKALDLDTDKPIDFEKSPEILFESPNKKTMDARMLKVYEKYKDFFSGKPTPTMVKGLIARFPSLTDDEAQLFLDEQYYSHRPQIYATLDTLKTKVSENKKVIIFGGALLLTAAVLYLRNRRTQTQQGA